MLDYFWTALTAGAARSHYHDGRIAEVSYAAGDTQHHRYGPGEFMIHDLENIGETELVFATVEFLDSANPRCRCRNWPGQRRRFPFEIDRSNEAWDRAVLRGPVGAEVQHRLVDIAPAPAFRGVVALDDGVGGCMKMRRRVAMREVVAAADMAAGPA